MLADRNISCKKDDIKWAEDKTFIADDSMSSIFANYSLIHSIDSHICV